MRAPFVWVPAAAVLLQQHVERLVRDADVTSLLSAEPTVLAGLALQVPCGLIAFWLVRTLLRAADELGLALARRSTHLARLPLATGGFSFGSSPLRTAALASRHAGRAPPLAA